MVRLIMSKKIHIVTKLARQYEGEYIFLNVLGAFKDIENANKFLAGKQMKYGEQINGVNCVVEVGIIQDIEILDEE